MKELMQIWKTHKSNPLHAIVPIVVNLPVFLGMYWGMLSMCDGSLPSLAIESGLPWVQDLSKPDPLHILNLAVPLSLAAQVQLNALDGLEGMTGQMKTAFKWMGRVLPIVMVPVMWNVPSALCLYWTYSNVYSIAFSGLLRMPSGALTGGWRCVLLVCCRLLTPFASQCGGRLRCHRGAR